MPIYEYRCPTCGTSFEQRRPASESGLAGTCPQGHAGARRKLSLFATAGRSADAPTASAPAAGGCGPGCACAAAGR